MEGFPATPLPSSRSPLGRRFPSEPPARRRSFPPGKRVVVSARRSEMEGGRDGHRGGSVVDQNMIVLRMRIKEMEWAERSHAPPGWTEWEKEYYGSQRYSEDVCEAMGWLQLMLMNTRPCLAIGMAAMVALSVPISAYWLLFHAMEMANALVPGFHIN
ncbi:uncharacterized protein LOC127809998 [Diospyros lotus]|uniref:uncharacterized protein LOC127809998 n=1 Tax=Diospyros lotus TaxID=55363 RepID=UPI00225BD98E|nr:uncharacterized protein LOC127809998 [Diospyros lotus]